MKNILDVKKCWCCEREVQEILDSIPMIPSPPKRVPSPKRVSSPKRVPSPKKVRPPQRPPSPKRVPSPGVPSPSKRVSCPTKQLSRKPKLRVVSKIVMSNKKKIIENLKIMINKVYAENDKEAGYKAREYTSTIKALSEFDGEINTVSDAQEVLHNFGKKNPRKTLKKINEILTTGKLKAAEKAKQNPVVAAVGNLTQVYGIGYKNAIGLFNKYNIVTVDQLRATLAKNPGILNSKQKIGLRYFDDLNEKIPRSEMEEYETYLTEVALTLGDNLGIEIELSVNGSYRRNKSLSGDIDVLITADNPSMARSVFIDLLEQCGVLVETLAKGKKKYMGVTKLPDHQTYRHMDIIQSDRDSYVFGQLYFTGSGGFNAKMRGIANDMGYSLNEYGITHKSTKKPLTKGEIRTKLGKDVFETEEDVFEFLNMDYLLPEERINVTLGKL